MAVADNDTRVEPADYLSLFLDPLARYFDDPDVTDVYVNRPGEVWIERIGAMPVAEEAPDLTSERLARLCRQIAASTHQGLSREQPLLSGQVPGNIRAQIVMPPATRGAIAIAFRKHLTRRVSIADYHSDDARLSKAAQHGELKRLYDAGDWPAFLSLAVKARLTILISGGTSTGKTTFLNALLRDVDLDERIILIEDTPEIELIHPNSVGLVAARSDWAEANVDSEALLIASLRLRPDRILLGEIRGAEAFAFLRAVNTGHEGSMSTIHANSPDQALEQLALLCARQGSGMQRTDIIDYARATIDIIVQLGRSAGQRRISDVSWQSGRKG